MTLPNEIRAIVVDQTDPGSLTHLMPSAAIDFFTPSAQPGSAWARWVRSTSTWSGTTRCHVEAVIRDQARSKRSRFITLVQAATKSWTNFACASELP